MSYTWDSGWSLQSSPTITFDWTADAWTLPLGVDVGKTFSVGTQAMSLMVGAYDLAKRQTGDPDSFVRVQLTVLFPSGEN